MYKAGVCADGSHAGIQFLKQEIKHKRLQSKFEIKIWNEIKLKLIFKWNRTWNKLKV